eukprot:3179565-Karenia_brevis.AAC.1
MVVEDKYDSQTILGKKAAGIILKHSARASHHEFPYGMNILAQLLGGTNGAGTDVFPGAHSPLALPICYVNYPQT